MRFFLQILILILLIINLVLAIDNHQQSQNATQKLKQKVLFTEFDKTAYTMQQLFSMEEQCYMVYFYSQDCSACLSSNEMMLSYLEKKKNNLPIYFVDVSLNPSLLSSQPEYDISYEQFGVYYTPCLLFFDNQQVNYYQGQTEIFALLSQQIEK